MLRQPLDRDASRAAAALALAIALLPGCGDVGGSASPTAPPPASADAGARVFAACCAACHGPAGEGTNDGPPPLANSDWVGGSGERLARIVLHGLHGPIEVAGRTYNLEMPGFGPVLNDAQIADVIAFVRRLRGVPATESAVDVARIRAATADREVYWTAAELQAVP